MAIGPAATGQIAMAIAAITKEIGMGITTAIPTVRMRGLETRMDPPMDRDTATGMAAMVTDAMVTVATATGPIMAIVRTTVIDRIPTATVTVIRGV